MDNSIKPKSNKSPSRFDIKEILLLFLSLMVQNSYFTHSNLHKVPQTKEFYPTVTVTGWYLQLETQVSKIGI